MAILYHGSCPDGLGGAYAAWKKFGEEADYIPAKHGSPAPEHLDGKELYFIDFCYPREIMNEIAQSAKSIVVLDHHEGVRDVATKFPGVFDTTHSGAAIAWHYFHPGKPVPTLLAYIEDRDLYRFGLPNSREMSSYIDTIPLTSFEHWEELAREMEDSKARERMIAVGSIIIQYHQHIVETAVNHAELVRFEGYECYLAGALGEFRSDTGNALARKKPPIAIIISADASGIRISLRSDGSVDVAAIARKYGGNGHPAAAGFRIPFGSPIPWEPIEQNDEDTGN